MISLNIFSKCPHMGNPKTRLKDFLTKDERTFITKYMLTNILNEVSQLNDGSYDYIMDIPKYRSSLAS